MYNLRTPPSVKRRPLPYHVGLLLAEVSSELLPFSDYIKSIPWTGHFQAFEGVVEKAEELKLEAKTEPQKETKEQEPTIEAKAEKVEEPHEATEDTEPVEKPREDIEEAKDANLKDTAGDAMEDVSEKMLEEKQNEEKLQPHKGFLQ